MGSDKVEWLGGQLSIERVFYKSVMFRNHCNMYYFYVKGAYARDLRCNE